MIEKTIEVEAVSLDEAREQINSQVPKGFHVIMEQIISDGKPQTAKSYGDTTEAALAKGESNIPNNADILEHKVLSTPQQKIVTIEAFDEHIARSRARASQTSKGEEIKSVEMTSPGSKGFLGIGKKPNQYKIEVVRDALVEITYKTKVKVITTIGKLEQQEISKLVKVIKNIWGKEKAQQEAANKLIREGAELAIEPLQDLLMDEEISVREIAITSLSSISTELPKTAINSLEQAIEKHEKDLALITQQIEPLVNLLRPLQDIQTVDIPRFESHKEIREIGETINKIGGHSAMWIPYDHINTKYRYPSLGNILDYSWNGIGTWRR